MAAPEPRDGAYRGTGSLVFDPGQRSACRATIPVTDFTVTGSGVRFGGFRGTVDRNGRLEMQSGHRFITGQFSGGRFEGRLWQPPPGCTYHLVLDPVG